MPVGINRTLIINEITDATKNAFSVWYDLRPKKIIKNIVVINRPPNQSPVTLLANSNGDNIVSGAGIVCKGIVIIGLTII